MAGAKCGSQCKARWKSSAAALADCRLGGRRWTSIRPRKLAASAEVSSFWEASNCWRAASNCRPLFEGASLFQSQMVTRQAQAQITARLLGTEAGVGCQILDGAGVIGLFHAQAAQVVIDRRVVAVQLVRPQYGLRGRVGTAAALAGQANQIPGPGLDGQGRLAQFARGLHQRDNRFGIPAGLNQLFALPQLPGARRPAGRQEHPRNGDDGQGAREAAAFFCRHHLRGW